MVKGAVMGFCLHAHQGSNSAMAAQPPHPTPSRTNLPLIPHNTCSQSAILESLDIYQPIDLGKQLLQTSMLEADVGLALLNQLGGNKGSMNSGEGTSLEELCSEGKSDRWAQDWLADCADPAVCQLGGLGAVSGDWGSCAARPSPTCGCEDNGSRYRERAQRLRFWKL